MIEALRTGRWLTPARLRIYPLILLGFFAAALVFLGATAHGDHDRFGRPLGTDFSEVWAAGQSARNGVPENAYDPAAHRAEQTALFGPSDDYYLWSYPPYFLIVAALLASLPYLAALLLWQAATLALYLAAVFASLQPLRLSWKQSLAPLLAFPAVFLNLVHGQNGFLTAALLTGGIVNLQRRPWLAGSLFACLAYKPQYTLMVPFALLAGRQWRAIASGVLTLGMMTTVTLLLFGTGAWSGFFEGITTARQLVLDDGGAGLEKMQSLYAAARLCGAPVALAYGIQLAGFTGLAGAIVWLWHSSADTRLKGAGLLTAALLATPYSFDYDLVALGPALAMLVSWGCDKGFRPYQKTLLSMLWLMPLFARPFASATSLPLACFSLCGLILFIISLARPRSQAGLQQLSLSKC